MDYYVFKINEPNPSKAEILLARCSALPFDTFEENEEGFAAYVAVDQVGNIEETLTNWSTSVGFTFSKEFIPYQNWNAIWESNFQPIQVGNFCGIRADFHPPFEGVEHELVINPEMAFGTGHHETTYMVIAAMEKINWREAAVLDYGCGTGILAVLAAKLGAKSIAAVDIELPSYENTLKNAQINHVDQITAYHGDIAAVPQQEYDFILANINRNVILASLSTLVKLLAKGGIVFFSGFILDDEQLLRTSVEKSGLTILNVQHRNNWVCLTAKK